MRKIFLRTDLFGNKSVDDDDLENIFVVSGRVSVLSVSIFFKHFTAFQIANLELFWKLVDLEIEDILIVYFHDCLRH